MTPTNEKQRSYAKKGTFTTDADWTPADDASLKSYLADILHRKPQIRDEVRQNRDNLRMTRMDHLTAMRHREITPAEYFNSEKAAGIRCPSVSTLYRLIDFAENDPARLGGNHHSKGRRTTLPAEQFIAFAIYRFAFPKLSSTEAYNDLVNGIAPARGWVIKHSEDRFRQTFNRIDEDIRSSMLGRNINTTKTLGFHIPKLDLQPHKQWQCDPMQFNQYLIDDVDGTEDLIRPWLTSIIDQGSRARMGWLVTRSKPTAIDFLLVLRHAFLPHGEKTWYALPEVIVTDNDPIFTTPEVRRCYSDLGIRHEPIASEHPAQNGRAERNNRRDRDLFEGRRKPFLVKVNGKERECHGYWSQFAKDFSDWAIADCKDQPRKVLGNRTAFQAYKAGTRPEQLPTVETVYQAVCLREKHKVGGTGIKMRNGRTYYCEQTVNYKGRTVIVTVPPDGPKSHQMWVEVDLIKFGPLYNLADAPEKAAAMEQAQDA